MLFIDPLSKGWLESCKCSSVVECHLASSGQVPDIARMDCDEGAGPAIWHTQPAMCTCSAESPVGSAGDGKSCAKHSGPPTAWICARFGTHFMLHLGWANCQNLLPRSSSAHMQVESMCLHQWLSCADFKQSSFSSKYMWSGELAFVCASKAILPFRSLMPCCYWFGERVEETVLSLLYQEQGWWSSMDKDFSVHLQCGSGWTYSCTRNS